MRTLPMKRAFALALLATAASASAYKDPNPFADYTPAMASDPVSPMGVEWHDRNRAALEAATADAALAEVVACEANASALCAKVLPRYRTDPLAACQIAAVSQYVTAKAGSPWWAFWKSARTDERRLWTRTLLRFAAAAEDVYVKEYFLDQLRWCGFPCQAAKVLATADGVKCPAYKAFAENVARELACAKEADLPSCPCGKWALSLPFPNMNTGHLILEKDASGALSAKLLWRWASPTPMEEISVDSAKFSLRRAWNKPKGKENDRAAWRALKICGEVHGDVFFGRFCEVDGNGKRCGDSQTFTGRRNPAIGEAPDLSKLVYGPAIDLLAGTLEKDFALMEPGALNGWTLKDGVLSNRITRDKDKKAHNGNLRTVRADFYDFKLSYDVRVLPGCNSGVYLRGIYEIQVLDSYGKPVDCHNMAAYYGRVTPCTAAEKPANEWQHVDVTLAKRHLTVILNGTKIIDNVPVTGITGGAMTANEFVPGPLYIQGDHSDADFRNMILTPILDR